MIYLVWISVVVLIFLIVYLLTGNLQKRVRVLVLMAVLAFIASPIVLRGSEVWTIMPALLLLSLGFPYNETTNAIVLFTSTALILLSVWLLLSVVYFHASKEMNHKVFLVLVLSYSISLIMFKGSFWIISQSDCLPTVTNQMELYHYHYSEAKPSLLDALRSAFIKCDLGYTGGHPLYWLINNILGISLSIYLFKNEIVYTSGQHFFGLKKQRFIAVIVLIVSILSLLSPFSYYIFAALQVIF